MKPDHGERRRSAVNRIAVTATGDGRRRKTAASGPDAEAVRLIEDLLSYPGVPSHWRAFDPDAETVPMITIDIEKNGDTMLYFTLISSFGTPNDVTLQELRIETMFPADTETDGFLKGLRAFQSRD